MFGQDTLYGNSMNGIHVLSDGITQISNGEITATNISADNLSGDNINIGSVSTTHIFCSSLQLNDVATAEFETLDGIDTGTTVQQQLNGKGSLGASNNWTGATNTFVDISASSIHLNGTDLQTVLDDIRSDHTSHDHDAVYAQLHASNTFTGDYDTFKMVTTGSSLDPSYFTGNFEKGLNINPHMYKINGVTASPVYGGFHLPYSDGNAYIPVDTYFAGVVNTPSAPTSNGHLTNKQYVDIQIGTRASLTGANTFSAHNTFTDVSANNLDATNIDVTDLDAGVIHAADVSATNIDVTNIDASYGIINTLTDGSSNYITQSFADARYFIHDGSLEVSKDITNVVQTSDAANGTIITYTAPAGVSNNINVVSAICHVMGFMQPNAVTTGIGASDKVPTFPFTPIARNSLD